MTNTKPQIEREIENKRAKLIDKIHSIIIAWEFDHISDQVLLNKLRKLLK